MKWRVLLGSDYLNNPIIRRMVYRTNGCVNNQISELMNFNIISEISVDPRLRTKTEREEGCLEIIPRKAYADSVFNS